MSKTSENNKALLATVTMATMQGERGVQSTIDALKACKGFKDRKPVIRAFTLGYVAARLNAFERDQEAIDMASIIFDGVSPGSAKAKVKGANVFVRTADHERILASCRKAFSRLMGEAFPTAKAKTAKGAAKAEPASREPRMAGVTARKVKANDKDKTPYNLPEFASRSQASKYFQDHIGLLHLIADKNAGVTFKVGKERRNVMANDVSQAISQVYTALCVSRDPGADDEAGSE